MDEGSVMGVDFSESKCIAVEVGVLLFMYICRQDRRNKKTEHNSNRDQKSEHIIRVSTERVKESSSVRFDLFSSVITSST